MLWSNDRTDRLSRQPASPTSGEFEARIMGARTEEMDGGTLRLTARLKEHGLGLDIKTFSARAKWRCSSRLRRSVDKKCLTGTGVVRDSVTFLNLRASTILRHTPE